MFSAQRLNHECHTFCRYLTGHDPDAYVVAKYREGHQVSHWLYHAEPGRFDALLLDRALRGPLMTRLADTYACLFYRRALLRQKLVLVLAIVESRTPGFGALDGSTPRTAASPLLALLSRGLAFSGLLACSVFTFAPAHLRLRSRPDVANAGWA